MLWINPHDTKRFCSTRLQFDDPFTQFEGIYEKHRFNENYKRYEEQMYHGVICKAYPNPMHDETVSKTRLY